MFYSIYSSLFCMKWNSGWCFRMQVIRVRTQKALPASGMWSLFGREGKATSGFGGYHHQSQTLVKSHKVALGPEIRGCKLSCDVITIMSPGQYMGLQGNEWEGGLGFGYAATLKKGGGVPWCQIWRKERKRRNSSLISRLGDWEIGHTRHKTRYLCSWF